MSNKHPYIAILDKVVEKEIKLIGKEENVELFGYGGGMLEGIKRIDLTFVSYQKVDLAKARRMIVYWTERIGNAVNSKEELKKYLIPYPF